MNVMRTTLIVALAAALFAAVSEAAPSRPAVAAQACAESINEHANAKRFEVVRMVRQGGQRSFTFWLNASDADLRGYCVVRAGEIVQTQVLSGHWQRTRMFRPAALQTAGT